MVTAPMLENWILGLVREVVGHYVIRGYSNETAPGLVLDQARPEQ